jgi:hypothetical protein
MDDMEYVVEWCDDTDGWCRARVRQGDGGPIVFTSGPYLHYQQAERDAWRWLVQQGLTSDERGK